MDRIWCVEWRFLLIILMIPFVFSKYISQLVLRMAFRLYICALVTAKAFMFLRTSISYNIPRVWYLRLVGNCVNAGSTIIGDSRAPGSVAECRVTCMMPRHLRIIVCGGVIYFGTWKY
jgi:hypothetical protein